MPSPSAADSVEFVVTIGGPPIHLACRGDLDLASEAALVAQVQALIAYGHTDLRLDLTQVGFCDLRGLSALLTVRAHLVRAGGALTVVHPCPGLVTLCRLLGATGLLQPPTGDGADLRAMAAACGDPPPVRRSRRDTTEGRRP